VGLADYQPQAPGMWPVQVDDPTSGAVHVTASNLSQFSLQIGSNIAPFAFISVPVAFDSAHNATRFVQYSITTVDPSLYAPTSAPTPDDVVAAAKRYAVKYQNVDNLGDCHVIAQDVASAAGATLDDPTESTDPSTNVSAGFWRVVYRGSDLNPVSNWSVKVQKGDIVRVGWANGGAHTFTVVDVGGTMQGSDGLVHRDLTVYDNGFPDNNGIPDSPHPSSASMTISSKANGTINGLIRPRSRSTASRRSSVSDRRIAARRQQSESRCPSGWDCQRRSHHRR
jgi:hypothetical protein